MNEIPEALRAGPFSVAQFRKAGLNPDMLRDVHIDLPRPPGMRVMLHRTRVMPPCDDTGVTPAAAFVQLCASKNLGDLVAAGDWLLHREFMSVSEVADAATIAPWRPGARQSRCVVPWLDSQSRSPQESRTRTCLVMAGLPAPESNATVDDRRRETRHRRPAVSRLACRGRV